MRDYPNVYTDISCWDFREHGPTFRDFLNDPTYGDVKDRILFGTDWYLSLAIMGGKSYRESCEETQEFLDEIDPALWARFALVNPFEFYDLGNEARLKNLEMGLETVDADRQKVREEFTRVMGFRERVDQLKQELHQ